jgi:hypothetical protein
MEGRSKGARGCVGRTPHFEGQRRVRPRGQLAVPVAVWPSTGGQYFPHFPQFHAAVIALRVIGRRCVISVTSEGRDSDRPRQAARASGWSSRAAATQVPQAGPAAHAPPSSDPAATQQRPSSDPAATPVGPSPRRSYPCLARAARCVFSTSLLNAAWVGGGGSLELGGPWEALGGTLPATSTHAA